MVDEQGSGSRLGRWLGVLDVDRRPTAEHDENWRLNYLFSIATVSWIIHFCVTMLAGVVLLQAGLGAWVPVWMVSMALLSLALATVALAYRHRKEATSPEVYGAAHSVLTAAIGLVWGIGAVLCAMSASTEMLTFYTLVLGGTALGAVSSQHILMRSCLLSIWTSVPLLALAWLVNGVSYGPLATAGMMVLFGVTLTVLATRMNGAVEQNVMLADALAARNEVLLRTSAGLAEAHEEKSRFLAQASHDLRQPIHAIGLFVEYLHGVRLGREGREVLHNIDRSLESLTRLCRSLLDLSALDVGRVKPEIGPVSLGELMGEVIRQASEPALARNVTIRFRPSRYWVRSDPALLHTMVQNLVSNAIKYAPGAQLLVGVRRRNGALSIVVADTGPGIASEDQQRIFKEFVQIKAPDTAEADGLGLGLSIVHRLAEMLGLRVTVASKLTEGSTFCIDGLGEAQPASRPRRQSPAGHVHLLAGLRVLVVDDDRAVRDSTVQLLTRWGCAVRATDRVTLATDPDEFDFLLFDQELADGEIGLSHIRNMRARSSCWIPAALITGGRTDHLVEPCKAEEVAILAKPVRPTQLRSVLLSGAAGRTNLNQTTPSSEAMPAAAVRLVTPSARSSAET
ncbi:hybrid sensor histidine kinase/response regulator [Methyloceanibacter sp. wino2]|uniref:ATP-binding response regulator n=1 Tax=Methyloceanibacter sp. wino2 TaxID=2170729 RepID=UPI000D3E4BFA|nr:hybrid sensor histidine kinase/response regulator [Methyloceanibacter sp. wino2]